MVMTKQSRATASSGVDLSSQDHLFSAPVAKQSSTSKFPWKSEDDDRVDLGGLGGLGEHWTVAL